MSEMPQCLLDRRDKILDDFWTASPEMGEKIFKEAWELFSEIARPTVESIIILDGQYNVRGRMEDLSEKLWGK